MRRQQQLQQQHADATGAQAHEIAAMLIQRDTPSTTLAGASGGADKVERMNALRAAKTELARLSPGSELGFGSRANSGVGEEFHIPPAHPQDICYYCKRRGHWRQDCPDFARDHPEQAVLQTQLHSAAAGVIAAPHCSSEDDGDGTPLAKTRTLRLYDRSERAQRQQHGPTEQAWEKFRELDHDQNGFLDRNEIKVLIKQIKHKSSDRAVGKAMQVRWLLWQRNEWRKERGGGNHA